MVNFPRCFARFRKKKSQGRGGMFAIVASRYNARYVDAMVQAAKAELQRAFSGIRVFRVPGAYEIPLVAKRLARAARKRNRNPRFRPSFVWA
jgi:6,7-dimethyl-8-ribityllumazine synthase